MSEPAIARLVGEGVERPEASLPLDINYAKLAEWLVTRQKIPKDWHKRLQVIHAKAAEALKEVPPEVLTSLADGSDAPLDYLRAVEIRDKLSSTAERTMFGGLSGPAATWDKIVKAYEKQYVFLGECASILVQNVDFEIPYLRKQAAKQNQQIVDCDRKHSECLRNAALCAAKYKEECKKLGVQGVSVRQELRGLASELPGMLRGVVESLHDPRLQSAAEYYAAFTRFAHAPRGQRGGGASAAADLGLEPSAMLPTLLEIRARQTQPPASSEDTAGAAAAAASSVVVQEATAGRGGGIIDWDLGTQEAAEPGPGAVVDIDWDVGLGGEEAGAAADGGGGGGGGGGINWDIDMPDETSGAGGDTATTTAPAEAAAPATTIDWDIAYRARLMDDLLELRAFLAQVRLRGRPRKTELSGSGNELLATALPDDVREVDAGAVAGMLAAVQQSLGQLTTPRFRQLLLIATSQRYLDRLEASLKRQAGTEAKLLRAAADVVARKQDARSQLVELAPRLATLVERTRRLKALSERSISAALGGKRTVNVLGEINNVLAAAQ
ncbi:hypothetical protein VOLCADRAFT_80276 [Volvox carteri f. nagariensis]|uniref:CDK5RAP3-like protein n=1 Tax=Volvox carteri f. nagariensis TaxID=3068 RepID=D8TQC4_VOLCA|nr:uncharacterized protein VOLCADRAFT_80276 [Volvox carteri f. nagariensis]EFJ50509.1 hypothetical protein VOLCADRAFT_80276 [Volvox carteri f. nagariensis]|eukprot:XP_002948634.1 hypothetical protein VOLCADRAFT_80276 [Volvox carteri f. nagariensis]